MELQQRREAKQQLTSGLMSIPGVCHVGLSHYGLVINVDAKSGLMSSSPAIMDFFEKNAPDCPYVVKQVATVK